MRNDRLSEIFEEMADIMEILGENPFRINTYHQVARIISELPDDVGKMLDQGLLEKTQGVGKSSIAKIKQFVQTGTIDAHQDLLKKIPRDLPKLLKIPNLGPKGAREIHEKLGVSDMAGLKKAIDQGKLAELPRFGEKKAQAIKKGIDFLERSAGRIRIDQAQDAAEKVIRFLNELSPVRQIRIAGSLRRMAETIGDVDILVEAEDGKKVIDEFINADFIIEKIAAGPTKGSALVQTETSYVHVDVRVVAKESFGSAWQYFTGSQRHNIRLREIAVSKKLKLNEYGLFRGKQKIAGEKEEDIYSKLDLDYIEPVLREDRGEVDAAQKHKLPRLLRLEDIRGNMHIHSDASDGNCSIEQLAQAAKAKGYDYIAITDHSRSSQIANGLDPKRLSRQISQIHKLNQKLKGITILAGSEVDILNDGSMDFDDKLLADLDFVFAAIHSGMQASAEKVTDRTLRAMDNPYVNCISHPTGRLLGKREAMSIDIAKVIKHAAQTGTALELNANPQRLDLKDVNCRNAVNAGVKLVIATDAHSIEGMDYMRLGVATACRGWAGKDDVLNTLTADKLKKWAKTKRPK